MAAVMAEASKKKVKEEIDWGEVKESDVLERWQWSYKKWGPGIIKRLVFFCDAQMRITVDSKLWGSKDETQRML
eukprot:14348315-Alexandrium_andersonii.AAC.1